MFRRGIKVLPLAPVFFFLCILFWMPRNSHAQGPLPSRDARIIRLPSAQVEILLTSPDGQPLTRVAVLTLTRANGELYREEVTRGGRARLDEVVVGEYNLKIVAPGYSTTTKPIAVKNPGELKLTFPMEPASEGIDAITDREMAALGQKGQKALAKAIESLRNQKIDDARKSLQKAFQLAPQSAEVQYLFGVCEEIQKNSEKAKSYWNKALDLDPQHYRALLSMSEALLQENRAAEAVPFVERADKAEPTAWRPQALYAEAYLKQGKNEEAVQHARRAQELGHTKASVVEPILAAALRNQGNDEQAAAILQAYANRGTASAKSAATNAKTGGTEMPTLDADMAEALGTSWMPPDIDEKVGALEPGVACSVDDVLKKVAARIDEFLHNVDRFTATESLQHESILKSGIWGPRIDRKFNYVVEMREIKAGYFSVDESRMGANGTNEFADGLATKGLPAMILIFHPNNVGNFEVSCEGLAERSGGRAWQLHFRQRTDRPNTIRAYRLGLRGRSYPVNLKGRAWISADTFQVLRLETQMIAPVREIELMADYAAVEYGPVHFNKKNVDMWLPQTAEAYSFWRGKRSHQSHTFSNYILFSVDDKQKISAPKVKEEQTTGPNGGAGVQNR